MVSMSRDDPVVQLYDQICMPFYKEEKHKTRYETSVLHRSDSIRERVG